ncbi:SusC/RagA family TonB-linked outer membrane protein [Hanstruepera ponticola]|uniref:SusC/RagA family TonB-linked outer membrane protein n=1 Tax=Hanstruepera ponticola TaxID=2042995 RepID=UPI000CF0C78F|nr:SusC/RagA family TonB-linked outer membrane protein [Hanstruepera ponticola]
MKTKFSGILTLFLAFVVQLTFAQEKTISGTISDENGLPLPGVNIIVKGTTTGTQTDFDGNYSITANTGDVLSYSFLGYTTKEMTVGTANNISFAMEVDSEALEEVVITGYGIAREKREITYQTEEVDEQLLNQAQTTRAATGLAGKVAGLQINVQNNGVNPSSQIILRGLRSITGNNEALIVIDGSITSKGAFDDLNPNDIQDINVLKGATAAALYGSRAGNGALIITTKKGKLGETLTVGLNSTVTFEDVAYMPDLQDEYGPGIAGGYDPYENTNWGPRFDGISRRVGPIFEDGTFQSLPYAPVKDNARNFYDTGITSQNTIYLSGGNETSTMYLSIGNQDTKGIVPKDRYKRTTLRANATKKVGDFELALNSTFLRDESNVVGNNIGSQSRTLYWFVLNQGANIPLENYSDWENDLYSSPDGYYNGYYQNPYWAIDNNRNTDKSNRLTANMSVTWDVFDWLDLTGRVGGNILNGSGKEWRNAQAYNSINGAPRPTNVTSFLIDNEFQRTDYTFDFLANMNFDINDDFSLKAILGASSVTEQVRASNVQVNNLSIPGLYDVSNGTGAPVVGAAETEKRTYGYFADLTIGFKNFLFLNASGRYDFTSTLPVDDNSYFYPSIGLSAVLTDAIPSIKGNVLNYAKVTVSNSTVYNDLAPEQIIETYGQNAAFPFGAVNGFEIQNQAIDSSIKKEKINTTEVGLNLGFFNNRLTLDAAYFKTITTDNIVSSTSAPSSASTSLLTNIGKLEGDGIEITLGGTIVKAGDFSWDASLNFTKYKTVVKEIGNGVSEINLASTGEVGVYAIEGEEFPVIQASAYVRDPNGNVVIDPSSGNPLNSLEVNGRLKNLGTTVPDYILGLNTSFNYKGIRLAGTFDYRTGHVYYAQGSDAMEFTGRSIESTVGNRQDFVWPNSVIETSPGVYVQNTNIPITGGSQQFWTDVYNEIKENYVRDATAVKLRELSLSYTLSSKLLENTPVKKLSVGIIGRNLITWLPEENRFSDPEFANGNGPNGNAIGIGGYFQSPPTRSIGFNLNVEF